MIRCQPLAPKNTHTVTRDAIAQMHTFSAPVLIVGRLTYNPGWLYMEHQNEGDGSMDDGRRQV